MVTQHVSVSLAMPTNLIRRDYCVSVYGTMEVLPDDVTLMTRHGRVYGDTTNIVEQRA